MDLPTTRLPIVGDGILEGLSASVWEYQALLDDLKITNPRVWQYIHHLVGMDKFQCAKTCLLLYKILETQAECDELGA